MSDHRNTPQGIADMIEAFGVVDIDPCSNAASVVKARFKFYEGGLESAWHGLIYVNGPWSDLLPWVRKSIEASEQGAEVLFLARTESATAWAHLLCEHRTAHVDLRKRWSFPVEGQPPTSDTRPTTISYFGPRVRRFRAVFEPHGFVYFG